MIGKHNREPHVFDSKNQTVRSVRLRFPLNNPVLVSDQDQFFQKASEFARVRGLPRIYVSCNSGAGVGLVEELKPLFKVLKGEEQCLGMAGFGGQFG